MGSSVFNSFKEMLGIQPSAECGRLVLYSTLHFSITICASFNE